MLRKSQTFFGILLSTIMCAGTASMPINADTPCVFYCTHVQDYGWMEAVYDGLTSGTVGQGRRVEALMVDIGGIGVSYRSHVQDYGWMNWVSNKEVSGTTGISKRLEAVQIKLEGEAANQYDIVYRAHVQDYGWMGWVKNGETAGTEGLGLRLEALEVRLEPKNNNTTYIVNTNSQSLNMLSGPSTGYSIITSIPKGTQVNVIEYNSGNGWSKIEYGGRTGYVSTQYLAQTTSNQGNNGNTIMGNPASGINSSSGFGWPLASSYHTVITAKMYYPSNGSYHGAYDFGHGGIEGQPVYAIGDGVVVQTEQLQGSYGNYVKIRHDNGIYSYYAHGQYGSTVVEVGQRVIRGQQLMRVGNTGNSKGPHLHLELRASNDSTRLNPGQYLPY